MPAIARENFPLRMMGTVIGGTAMAGSLGMATGPAGRRSDLRHLRQLHLGSISDLPDMGLGAFLISHDLPAVPERTEGSKRRPALLGATPRATSS